MFKFGPSVIVRLFQHCNYPRWRNALSHKLEVGGRTAFPCVLLHFAESTCMLSINNSNVGDNDTLCRVRSVGLQCIHSRSLILCVCSALFGHTNCISDFYLNDQHRHGL